MISIASHQLDVCTEILTAKRAKHRNGKTSQCVHNILVD